MNKRRRIEETNITFPGPIINKIAQLTGKPQIMRVNKFFARSIEFKLPRHFKGNIYIPFQRIEGEKVIFDPSESDIPFSKKKMLAVYSNYGPERLGKKICELYPGKAIMWVHDSIQVEYFTDTKKGINIYEFTETGATLVDYWCSFTAGTLGITMFSNNKTYETFIY